MNNKKLVLSVLSTALVSSMFSTAFAAGELKDGIYIGGTVDEFYTVEAFNARFDSVKTKMTAVGVGYQNVLFVRGGKATTVQAILDYTGSSYPSLLQPARVETFNSIDGDDGFKEILSNGSTGSSFDPRDGVGEVPTGEFAVSSVNVVDALHLEVKFSKAINTTDGADEALFSLSPSIAVSNASLSEDGKTVTLTLNSAMTNDTAYTVIVDKDIRDLDGNVLSDAVVRKPISFADHTKPTVSSISTEENGDLAITFSEALHTTLGPSQKVVVNGTLITSGISVSGKVVTVSKANLPVLTSGQSYSVIVEGFQDAGAYNTMNLYSGAFTYNVVNGAPTVSSVTVKDEKTLTVDFSEVLSAGLADDGSTATDTLKVYKNGVRINTDPVPVGGTNKKFDITLPSSAYATGETTASLKVVLEGYKDLSNNIGSKFEQTVTVTKDAVKPTVSKAQYAYNSIGADTVTVTFSETLATSNAADLAGKLYITNSSGVRYNVSATDVTPVTAGQKTFALTVDGTAPATLTLPNGTYTLHIAADAVKDQNLAENGNAATTVNFTVTGATADVAAPVVNTVVEKTSSNGIVEVTFDDAVKGGNIATSATQASNYKLDGADLPADTKIYLNAAQTVATIEFPEGYFTASQVHTLTVSNIEDTDGNKMSSSTVKTVAIDDNKRPELVSAKVVADELVLTFSENVDTDTLTTDFSGSMFDVTVNDIPATVVSTVYYDSAKKAELKLKSSDANFATGTIKVKVKSTATAADAAGNVVKPGADYTTATR